MRRLKENYINAIMLKLKVQRKSSQVSVHQNLKTEYDLFEKWCEKLKKPNE